MSEDDTATNKAGGISEEERVRIASIVDFFKCIDVSEFLRDSKYRDLRKVMNPLAIAMSERFYGGELPSEKKLRDATRKQIDGFKAKLKMKDVQLINATKLRQARIDRKEKLIESDGLDLRIPDGAVDASGAHRVVEVLADECDSMEDDKAELTKHRSCYRCKKPFLSLHHFYDQLCGPCAELNWSKREQGADLSSRTFILTGGRVRIGFQVGLKILRNGGRLIV
jgi:hypothetical protein